MPEDRLSLTDAKQVCEEGNGRLVTIETTQKYNFLLSLLSHLDEVIWIGGGRSIYYDTMP